ncbi:MAG: carboxylesterase family protein, partial [Bacteroidales bacterium]|nr:carboxylesterase family protein [Bacteroidales bacterium]
MKKLLLTTVTLLCLCACVKSEPGLVKVEGGYIQGVVTEEMTVYKGIPFAAPPVGELRWKAPQPVIAWEGVRQANEFSKGPVQGARNMDAFGEDCLYLNV